MGGGLLLLAMLPQFLPAAVIIPVHGTVQLASNASRFLLDVKNTCLKPFLYFCAGSIIGTAFGASLIKRMDLSLIPLIMSLFILLVLWSPLYRLLQKLPGKFFSLGMLQTGAALYVGATGPLSTSVLFKEGYTSDQVIVTNAAINTVINIAKIIVFSTLGFVFYEYWQVISAMAVSAILGSYLGTRYRAFIPEDKARYMIKLLITAFCLKNIVFYFWY